MSTIKSLGMLLVALVVLASCGEKESKQLNIAYANWSEGIAVTYLTKAVFEEEGYKVKLQNADIAPIFASLSRQKADVFMDTWLPVTHADYMDQYGDKIEIIGTINTNARIGLVVPGYVDIDSIEEMNDNKEKFLKQIVGIDAGAGIMNATEKTIVDYKLNYRLLTSSGPGMTAYLKKAIDKKEWIVVTGWTPHWMFDRFDLKFLEDPKEVYGQAEKIHTVVWKGFSKKDPFAAALLANITLTDKQISSLMAIMENKNMTEDEAARLWILENRELVESWIPTNEVVVPYYPVIP